VTIRIMKGSEKYFIDNIHLAGNVQEFF
jgi:hypothetical protein